MDELDEFLDSLSIPEEAEGTEKGDIDMDAELEELFKIDGSTSPKGDEVEDDSDDEFTLEGVGSNLQKLGLQKNSPTKTEEITPVKELVNKYNNPPRTAERQLLDKSEVPSSQKKDLIPALKERNSEFEVKSPEKSYDASNVGKIINSNEETSDADFLSWLSGSAEGGEEANQQDKTNKPSTPSRERVTKSALDYIQNLSAEESMGGGASRQTRERTSSESSRMPFSTGLSLDTSGRKNTETDYVQATKGAQASPSSTGPRSQPDIKQFFEEMFGEEFTGQGQEAQGEAEQAKNRGTECTNVPGSPRKATPRGGYFGPGRQQSVKEQKKEYEADLLELIRSPFPRVQELKETLRSGGYIPANLRGNIWSLFLTGSVTEDHEVAFFQPSGTELSETDLRSLANDCDAVLKRHPTLAMAPGGQTRSNLYDLVVLHCSRRKVQYLPLYTQLLTPLLCLPAHEGMSRPQASSCFQALATTFAPILPLKSEVAMGHAVDKVHAWTRLLVLYHSPALAHHLDRVLPGWERPTKGLSAAENEQKKNRNDLEDLEREYGLEGGAEPTEVGEMERSTEGEAGGSIASASPSKAKNSSAGECFRGIVPLHWICGLFSASLPSDQAILLLDWAVVNQERFAGVYLLASLFEVFAPFLLQMNGESIRQWTEEVSEGRGTWYKSNMLPSTAYGQPQTPLEHYTLQQTLSWPAFVEGWVSATAALRKKTPLAYRQALEKTEAWATAKYFSSGSCSLGDSAGPGKGAESVLFDFSPDKNASTASENSSSTSNFTMNDEEEESRVQKVATSRPTRVNPSDPLGSVASSDVDSPPTSFTGKPIGGVNVEGAKTAFMSVSRRMSAFAMEKSQKLRERASISTSYSDSTTSKSSHDSQSSPRGGAAHTQEHWAQDLHSEANTLCLWASATEVNPCVCTSRRPVPVPPVATVYREAAESSTFLTISTNQEVQLSAVLTTLDTVPSATPTRTRTNSKGSFHDEAEDEAAAEKPFYFGIDCRTDAERSLGVFPKALSVDPSFITDPSKISDILGMLEPLAQSVHLCIIGSGEEYIRFMFEQQRLRQQINPLTGSAFAQLLAIGRGFGLGSQESESELQLESLLREYRLKLNAIALFFLKRSFVHVSILDGGFLQAVRDLKSRPLTPMAPGSSMPLGGWGPFSSVLVDANEPMINKILRGEHDERDANAVSLQAKASAAAAAMRNSFSATSSQLLSHARANFKGEQNVADSDMDGKAHGAATGQRSRTSSSGSDGRERASSGGGRYSGDHAGSGDAAPAAAPTQAAALIGDIGKRFSMFGETVKSLATEKMAEMREAPRSNGGTGGIGGNGSRPRGTSRGGSSTGTSPQPSFTIEDDEDPTSPGAMSKKSKEEKALAMANHVMAGLKKGDSIPISRDALPGALLFPCTKMKKVEGEQVAEGEIKEGGSGQTVEEQQKQDQEVLVSRFLVVSRERLIVLDSHGKGVGAMATVKSNHHLTQLTKITFRRHDPNLVHLFFSTGLIDTAPLPAPPQDNEGTERGEEKALPVPQLKEKTYRVSKTKQFIEALQQNMKRFKE